jgi:hypothetical protein
LTRYLTDYSVSHAELIVERWRELGEYLVTTYNDGYVRNEKGRPEQVGYSEAWLRKVLSSRPEQFKLETWGDAESQEELLD